MIDQKIINAHQWVVDESERQPAWWAEQTAWAFIAADITAAALSWENTRDIVVVVLCLIVGTAMIVTARNAALLASLSERMMPHRMTFLALLGYQVYQIVNELTVTRAAHLLASVLLLSSYYFAACKPPRPRKRRQVFAQGGA